MGFNSPMEPTAPPKNEMGESVEEEEEARGSQLLRGMDLPPRCAGLKDPLPPCCSSGLALGARTTRWLLRDELSARMNYGTSNNKFCDNIDKALGS